MRLQLSAIALCACLVLSVGCGGKDPEKDRPKRTPVSGTVLWKGQPVEGATVMLHPNQGGQGSVAITDASGNFKMGTFGKDDGVVPAEYKASIRKMEAEPAGKQPGPDDPGYDPNRKPFVPKHLLPEKYADFTKSEFPVSVGAQPITDLKLELK